MTHPPPISYALVTFHSSAVGQAAASHTVALHWAMQQIGCTGPLIGPRSGGRGLWYKLRQYATVLWRTAAAATAVDVLYVRAHPLDAAVVAIARVVRVPVVLEVNGTPADLFSAHPGLRPATAVVQRVQRRSLREADGVVAVSDDLAAWVREQAPQTPVMVVPNAADPTVFHPGARTSLALPRRYVAFCGALAAWQGVEVMLAALDEPAWPDDVGLVIAGAGAGAEAVRRAARSDSRLVYLDVIPQPDVAGVLAGSLAGLSPNIRTDTAGSAMKLYETMAVGRPIIFSDVRGQEDATPCGVAYPARDPAALAAAVRLLAEDERRQKDLAARARAESAQHTWTARAERIRHFITSLSDRRRLPGGRPRATGAPA